MERSEKKAKTGREHAKPFLSYADQIDFVIELIAWNEGIPAEQLRNTKKYEEILKQYCTQDKLCPITWKVFNDHQRFPTYTDKIKNELDKKQVLWYFFDDHKYGIEHRWNGRNFELLANAIGQRHFIEKTNDKRTLFRISDKVAHFLNKKYSLYIPEFLGRTELIGITKVEIEFKNFVKVELRIFDSNQSTELISDGIFTFDKNENYLVIDLHGSNQRYIFEMKSVQTSKILEGIFYDLDISHNPKHVLLNQNVSEISKLGFYHKEILLDPSYRYILNYFENNILQAPKVQKKSKPVIVLGKNPSPALFITELIEEDKVGLCSVENNVEQLITTGEQESYIVELEQTLIEYESDSSLMLNTVGILASVLIMIPILLMYPQVNLKHPWWFLQYQRIEWWMVIGVISLIIVHHILNLLYWALERKLAYTSSLYKRRFIHQICTTLWKLMEMLNCNYQNKTQYSGQ